MLDNHKCPPVKSVSARNRPILLLPELDRCCQSLLGDPRLDKDRSDPLSLVLLPVLEPRLRLLDDAELTDGLRFLALPLLRDLPLGLALAGDARGMLLLDLCLLRLFTLESDLLFLGEADLGNMPCFPGAPLLLPVCNMCCLVVNESKLDGNVLYWVERLLSWRALNAPMAWP